MNEMWQMKQVASFFSSLVYIVYFESLIKKKKAVKNLYEQNSVSLIKNSKRTYGE